MLSLPSLPSWDWWRNAIGNFIALFLVIPLLFVLTAAAALFFRCMVFFAPVIVAFLIAALFFDLGALVTFVPGDSVTIRFGAD